MNHGTVSAYRHGCRCQSCAEAARADRRRGLPADDPRHGTNNAYVNFGCRCDACRCVASAATAKRKAARAKLPPGDPRHGTSNGYGNWSCRCNECRAAWTRDSYTTRLRRRARQDGVE